MKRKKTGFIGPSIGRPCPWRQCKQTGVARRYDETIHIHSKAQVNDFNAA